MIVHCSEKYVPLSLSFPMIVVGNGCLWHSCELESRYI